MDKNKNLTPDEIREALLNKKSAQRARLLERVQRLAYLIRFAIGRVLFNADNEYSLGLTVFVSPWLWFGSMGYEFERALEDELRSAGFIQAKVTHPFPCWVTIRLILAEPPPPEPDDNNEFIPPATYIPTLNQIVPDDDIGQFGGIKFKVSSVLPPGTIEFRNPDGSTALLVTNLGLPPDAP